MSPDQQSENKLEASPSLAKVIKGQISQVYRKQKEITKSPLISKSINVSPKAQKQDKDWIDFQARLQRKITDKSSAEDFSLF
jgi:hypothetical protein